MAPQALARADPACLPRSSRLRAGLGSGLLWAWALGVSLVLAGLMAPHWTTLPRPEAGRSALPALAQQADGLRWTSYHVLFADCPCSRSVLVSLLDRGPQQGPDRREVLLLVGEATELAQRATAAGFELRELSPAQLQADYGAEAAPLLLIAAPDGSLAYSGGHTQRRRAAALEDQRLLAELRSGRPVRPLPVYGCGISNELQSRLDPLGLKY